MTRQFHRPARLDPETAESIEGAGDPAVASELAHRSAQLLVGGFPGTEEVAASEGPLGLLTREHVVRVVQERGVDEVAELWSLSPATTLPGALWRLFLVSEWLRRDPGLIERRYATVVDLEEADDVVLARFEAARQEGNRAPSPARLRAVIENVLAGRLEGSVPALAPVLTAVSGFLLALAAGSGPHWIDDDADVLADRVTRRASALTETAEELAEAACRARSGSLD